MNIEGLSANTINKFDVDTILMSPPCQPFTRNGKQSDIKDSRTDSFQHILNLLPDLKNIRNILIENVKGFEKSEMRNILIKALKENSFIYQEFILSPTQFGISNSRHRYYCVAKKTPDSFPFEVQEAVVGNTFIFLLPIYRVSYYECAIKHQPLGTEILTRPIQ